MTPGRYTVRCWIPMSAAKIGTPYIDVLIETSPGIRYSHAYRAARARIIEWWTERPRD